MSLDKTQYSPKFIFEHNSLKNVELDKIFKFTQHQTSRSILKNNLDYYPVYYTYVDFYKFDIIANEININKQFIKTKLVLLNAKTAIFYGSKEELDIYIEKALVSLNIIILNINEYLIKKLLE